MGYVLADVGVDEAFTVVGDFTQQFLPFLEGELRLRLLEIVEARGITGIVGGLWLLVASAAFFLTVEEAFVDIFQGGTVRSFLHSRGLAVALIPAVIALVAFLHYSFLFADVLVRFLTIPALERIFESAAVDWVLSTAILAIEFFLVVYWFEGKNLRLRHLVTGAAVFCSLWIVARIAFSLYVQETDEFSIIYGSLGVLVVLVLWVYYASLVFLFACCITEALRRRSPLKN